MKVAQILWYFPENLRVILHEMVVKSGLSIDRAFELELLDDSTWLEVEFIFDNLCKLVVIVSFGSSSVAVDIDGDWIRNSDTISDLNKTSVAELVVHEGLGDPSGCIGTASVDFGSVLARKSTT